MTTTPRFKLVTLLAYNELLRQGINSLPVDTKAFKTPADEEILVASYQEFCKLTGIPLEALLAKHSLVDGCCVRGLSGNNSVVLYNSSRFDRRVRFTLIHEVGHIICSHYTNGRREEIEANFFASSFLMPGVILKELSKRGYVMDVRNISKLFYVSKAASRRKMFHMQYYNPTHLDSILLSRFVPYLDKLYPSLHPVSKTSLFNTEAAFRAYLKAEADRLDP